MSSFKSKLGICVVIGILQADLFSQKKIAADKITSLVKEFKQDIRGPYQSIRWFCDNGTIRMPKDPCPDSIGGIQHATYKDKVLALAEQNHIFLGQILAYTDKNDFWDQKNQQSRLKQYQLGKYLMNIDEGWINQKGQYYRGAIQIEDEEEWGVKFYEWVLSKDDYLQKNYFLLLQSLKDIPHKGDDNLSKLMRTQSKVISDQYAPFMDLRVKIHSNPEPTDITSVIEFKTKKEASLSPSIKQKLDELIATLKKFHQPVDSKQLKSLVDKLPESSLVKKELLTFIGFYQNESAAPKIAPKLASSLLAIRNGIVAHKSSKSRLVLLDIALQLEDMLFKKASEWNPNSLEELLEKNYVLAKSTAGIGLIERWEWDAVEPLLQVAKKETITLGELYSKLQNTRGVVEWSTAMVKATYGSVVNTYMSFEPLAATFIDDRIRGTIALQLGKSVGDLGKFITQESKLSNKVLNLENQSTIRGLNPGYAFGTLQVVENYQEEFEVAKDKIYIFDSAPSDLKPVAGIATVSEGNLVSHVQLLARNLGIPNATLSKENLQDLKLSQGDKVFYAVSYKGSVIMKKEGEMNDTEKALFEVKERNQERIAVPIQELKLKQNTILNLRDVNKSASGKTCGPKAANLGELKSLFPDKVVEGFVIPFGIFKEHMLQPMPGTTGSYWDFLNAMFRKANEKKESGSAEAEIENYLLEQLSILREAIKVMPLKAEFKADLTSSFQNILGKPIGEVPVFLRSDTNMEDLQDFTGAGLNLTLFNVLEQQKIEQGIKDVWASPYTERSFKWRQQFLVNPENVYPSILVIPSVDVNCSGVVITKGLSTGDTKELTIAFSKGAGGAVDGQAAESYLLGAEGKTVLIAPAREQYYKTLPATGGTGIATASFDAPILNEAKREQIRQIARSIINTMKEKEAEEQMTYDIELGFKDDQLYLFQIRPFVENKRALKSEYLESITPTIDINKEIPLAKNL
ncbi:PEP/pyruvate-binding domain-containing protein [Aquimarina brevivitae]|uniref:Phosphoenolpyruvate synthase n=1 Tax=Aquimarina brevivitae TaxID=323412 RepID=A0A4V2F593_9FLAO|nr:PEP/pyruvate-binding domain-containing protein [Aquimarina brevivitae]RZS92019.1 pyruvate phosphate dikinase-like enzyme [Aquimarina brevivitae]